MAIRSPARSPIARSVQGRNRRSAVAAVPARESARSTRPSTEGPGGPATTAPPVSDKASRQPTVTSSCAGTVSLQLTSRPTSSALTAVGTAVGSSRSRAVTPPVLPSVQLPPSGLAVNGRGSPRRPTLTASTGTRSAPNDSSSVIPHGSLDNRRDGEPLTHLAGSDPPHPVQPEDRIRGRGVRQAAQQIGEPHLVGPGAGAGSLGVISIGVDVLGASTVVQPELQRAEHPDIGVEDPVAAVPGVDLAVGGRPDLGGRRDLAGQVVQERLTRLRHLSAPVRPRGGRRRTPRSVARRRRPPPDRARRAPPSSAAAGCAGRPARG